MLRAALSCGVLSLAGAACGTGPQATSSGSAEVARRAAITKLEASKALIAQVSLVTVRQSSPSPLRQSGTYQFAAPERLAVYSTNWNPGVACAGGQPALVIDRSVGYAPVPPQCTKWWRIPHGFDAKLLIFMAVAPAAGAKEVSRNGNVYSYAYSSTAKGWTNRWSGAVTVSNGSVTSAKLVDRVEPPASQHSSVSTLNVTAVYAEVSPLKVRIPVPSAASITKFGQGAGMPPPGNTPTAS